EDFQFAVLEMTKGAPGSRVAQANTTRPLLWLVRLPSFLPWPKHSPTQSSHDARDGAACGQHLAIGRVDQARNTIQVGMFQAHRSQPCDGTLGEWIPIHVEPACIFLCGCWLVIGSLWLRSPGVRQG